MGTVKTTYNERSWAIDLISEINIYASKNKLTIKKAGGERTIKASKKSSSLFPDVLLFQDESSLNIIQGWELKMPDTDITDSDLIDNAIKKANLLGLNSFLLWNVSEAALYILKDGTFTVAYNWADLKDITKRKEVEANRHRWIPVLHDILKVLEEYFQDGEIKSKSVIESFSDNQVIDIILNNAGLVKANIQKEVRKDARLDALIVEWWATSEVEYSSEPDEYAALSKLVLLSWVNRILFTHYLKKFTLKALEIDDFSEDTTVKEAKKYFAALTKDNDFLNVYAPVIGEDYIDDTSWQNILQLSFFLSDLNLQDIDQQMLQQFFEKLLLTSKRKSAGQYATPYELADLLVRLVMIDKSKTLLDSFCGTGTILRASYDLKSEFGVTPKDTIDTIWGSDKFSFPLQMSTLSLAKPDIIGQVINVFKSDVKDLEAGKVFEFIDPNKGSIVKKKLPEFDYIISNLPFVSAAKIKVSNPEIFEINEVIQEAIDESDFEIPNKSDLVAYLPFYLWYLLADDGRLGVIVSNSWLGTEWGESFQKLLSRFYKLEYVLTSGKGIWFKNAKVVTNLLILQKRSEPINEPDNSESVTFLTLNEKVEELKEKKKVRAVASQVLLKRGADITVQTHSRKAIADFESMGLGWSALFADLSWMPMLKKCLIKTNTLFDINRGERRGWDKMFYPADGHGIEKAYLRPVLKNSREVDTLIGNADGVAFCCSKSVTELRKEGAKGALSWIRKFETGKNETGVPLTKSLARANHYWYEMKDSTAADLVGNINYGETLFIIKMKKRSFVNQRLIRFTAKDKKTNLDLCHALMNSYVGLFYIEALGFGRGQGALDLSSNKVKENHLMLNPDLLDAKQTKAILTAFAPITLRNMEKLPKEVNMKDRLIFEKAVANAYGLSREWDAIKKSLLYLFTIRMAVEQ